MKKKLSLKKIKNIVIIRTDRIGEVLLSTPVIAALRKHCPNADISFVTSNYAGEVVYGRHDLKEVVFFDTLGKELSVLDSMSLSKSLIQRKFDLAVVMNPHKYLHLAVFLARIPIRLGFKRKWPFLLTHKVEDHKDKGLYHEVEYNLGLLQAIGIKEKDIAPSIPHSLELIGHFPQKELKGIGDKLVVVHPGTSNPSKRWPLEYYIEVVKDLAKIKGVGIILSGDESEVSLCEQIKERVGHNVFNLAGKLKLTALIALLGKASLLITNDTAPMHIAAALGTKVIAIFGRNIAGVSPKRWGPYGNKHKVFHKASECAECKDTECPYGYKCLKAVTPEEVFKTAKVILE
ncbi:MAG: lipopolysaccharide heptosyltransferase II [Candidatus Omnitrophota bacterium]